MRTKGRVAAALAFASAFACADGPTGPPGSFAVSVAAPPTQPFTVGDTLRLEAEVRDHRGAALSGPVVTWSSSDSRVASVSLGGVVTAVAAGTATITAASGSASGTVQLSVADPAYVVLAALWIKTGGEDWTNHDNWLSDEDLDTWYGVDTDTAGRVVRLRLGDNNLTGHIPPELGDLENLTYLHLAYNELDGEIPAELGDLENLGYLDLRANNLTGSIPPELGNLESLDHLFLSHNDLTGSIPPEFGKLESLGWLDLSTNALKGPIPPELGNLESLRELGLDSNDLTGSIPSELGKLESLEALSISANGLTGSIPPELGNLARLEFLWLAHNELTDSIPAALGGIENLEVLWLSHNKLSGPLPASLGDLGALAWLLIGDNPLSGPLPLALEGLPLEVIGYASTDLCVPGTASFRAWLQLIRTHSGTGVDCMGAPGNRAALEALYDSTTGRSWTNDANWKSERPLNDWFGVTATEADTVTSLRLEGNNLFGVLPTEVGDLGNLEWLELDNNQLSGAVPPELGNLAKLTFLDLAKNEFRGAIPPELSKLANLTHLILSDNDLDGAIPPYLGGLATLKGLSLDRNQLTGAIPPELGNLANLDALALNKNGLTGAIPVEFARLEGLQYLLVSGNDVCVPRNDSVFVAWLNDLAAHDTDSLPSCAPPAGDRVVLEALYDSTTGPNWTDDTNWKSDGALNDWFGVTATAGDTVTEVRLQQNNLVGVLPPDLGNFANLGYLNLADNGLTGSIPRELGNLESLSGLGLWTNGLTGPIPPELGNLASLTQLSLTNNELTGSIPHELGNLSSLAYLQLGNNQLSGAIPVALRKLANLTRLILSDNQLDGAIPPELGNLASLEGLSLAGNRLTGAIPPELGDLANLVFLYVSRNQLSGTIPPKLGNLANLTHLEMRNNQLSGPIPVEFARLDSLQQLLVSGNDVCVPRNDSVFVAWLNGLARHDIGGLPSCASPAGDRRVLETLYDSTAGPNWTDDTNWKSDSPLNDWYGVVATEEDSVTRVRLESNNLVGVVPPELGDLESLDGLSLSHNELTGPIPPELGDLKSLEWLGLRDNRLTGSIPPELGDLKSLWQLFLDRNELRGSIPPELGNLESMQELWLSNNELTGSIPPELGKLKSLRTLFLRDNELTGSIPTELASLSSLATLSIGGNDVCVPRSDSGFMTWLEGLDSHDTDDLPSCSSGFRDDFDSSASLADWTIQNADADVGDGVLRLTNRVEDRLGLAERRALPSLTGWTIAARMGRVTREASPGVLAFTGHDRFAGIRFALVTRDSTNYQVALFDADADRWLSITNMSGHSNAVMEDSVAFTDITLGLEGDNFVAYADNDTRDEPAVLFRFDMDNTLDGVALRDFLHVLTRVWLINSGPVGLTSLHDWVRVAGTASGAATAATAAAPSGADPAAWGVDVLGVNRVRVEGADGGRGRELR